MFLGEVDVDRQRLPHDEAVIVDRRQAAVGVDREIAGLARPGRSRLDRDVLVIETELFSHPQHAKSTGARDPINTQTSHRISPCLMKPHRSHFRRRGIDTLVERYSTDNGRDRLLRPSHPVHRRKVT
jgi:hypothetical protein